MKCNRKYDFFAYHEGMMSIEMQKEIEMHLMQCENCKYIALQVKLMNIAIDEQKLESPDYFLHQRIVANILNKTTIKSLLRPAPVFAVVIFIALFAGIGLGVYFTNTGQQSFDNVGWNDQNQESIEMAFLNYK
jgi:hypothetical protein